jgi:peptidyl-tRNA hydrolase
MSIHPHDEPDPLALVLVVDSRHHPEGGVAATVQDLCSAAADGLYRTLHSQDPETLRRVREWTDDRIRKIVKHARGKKYREAVESDLPHIVSRIGSAEITVFAPLRPSEYWPGLAHAQVAGLHAERLGTADPAALPVHLNGALGMSTGKLVAQLCHAVQQLDWEYPTETATWAASGRGVRATWDEAYPGAAGLASDVVDAGYTEIPPDSHTAWILEQDLPRG